MHRINHLIYYFFKLKLILLCAITRLAHHSYFSFQAGQLNEYTERKDMSADVVCMALASVPSGEQRSRFLAVGLADNTVRIISLDPNVSANLIF